MQVWDNTVDGAVLSLKLDRFEPVLSVAANIEGFF